MKILVINGPNLNMLGIREPDIYGAQSFAALEDFIRISAKELSLDVTLFQSNHEGEIVDKIRLRCWPNIYILWFAADSAEGLSRCSVYHLRCGVVGYWQFVDHDCHHRCCAYGHRSCRGFL